MAEIFKKQIQIALGFTVSITDDEINALPNQQGALKNAQRALLRALVKNEDILREYLVFKLATGLGQFSELEWIELLTGDQEVSDESILTSVIETLPAEQKTFFQQRTTEEEWDEKIEALSEGFHLDLSEIDLYEVSDAEEATPPPAPDPVPTTKQQKKKRR